MLYLQGASHIHCIQGIRKVPTDDVAAMPVNNSCQIHVPVRPLDVGYVDRPCLVWQENELVAQPIWDNALLEIPFGEVDLRIYRPEPHLVHKAPYNLSGGRQTILMQFGYQLTAAKIWHHGMPVINVGHDIFFPL